MRSCHFRRAHNLAGFPVFFVIPAALRASAVGDGRTCLARGSRDDIRPGRDKLLQPQHFRPSCTHPGLLAPAIRRTRTTTTSPHPTTPITTRAHPARSALFSRPPLAFNTAAPPLPLLLVLCDTCCFSNAPRSLRCLARRNPHNKRGEYLPVRWGYHPTTCHLPDRAPIYSVALQP